jgi:hypothetical protein
LFLLGQYDNWLQSNGEYMETHSSKIAAIYVDKSSPEKWIQRGQFWRCNS